MRVPILSPSDDPAAKKTLTKRGLADLYDCFFWPPCPRRVKTCLSLLLCLALFVFALYLDIVAVLFWESLRRHSPDRALPLKQERTAAGGGQNGGGEKMENDSAADLAKLEERNRRMREALNGSLAKLLKGMPQSGGDGGWCDRMVGGQLGKEEAKALTDWKYDESQFQLLPDLKMANAAEIPEYGCSSLRRLLPFHDEPLSEEERRFPLSYGLVVHKSPLQVFALLSAIYQPQNAYCLAVDERADQRFRQEMNLLADCFPNIFVMGVGKIEWCQFGVVRGVFNCLRYLSQLNHGWRYYQYLSGVDLPLKTNLEMVRIFKRLNGTVNAEVLPFETDRVQGAQVYMKSPLTLWKSSMSALLSREAADAIVRSEKVRQFLRYLQYGYCTDEALWATMAGNPKELYIPGGFDANYLYGRLFKETYLSEIGQKQRRMLPQQAASSLSSSLPSSSSEDNSTTITAPTTINQRELDAAAAEPFRLATYYISRYQVWTKTNLLSGSKETKCNGTFVANSCVFGIGDLPTLIRRPEIVVHKMYLDFQPAAYFCLWKSIHERALDWRNQRKFEGKVYAQLPTVKLANGATEDELRFFFN